jgi:predicted metal-dependent enzyme (double-stranded beta helix superfamily)
MFDRDRFVEDCIAVMEGASGDVATARRDMKELVGGVVRDHASVTRGMGEPKAGGIEVLHRSATLTVLNLYWPVGAIVMPHDHAMWAVIGIYSGREDNVLWRRLPGDAGGRVEAAGAKSLCDGDTIGFGADVIHSVINPIPRVTGAIHVYGGDFFAADRHEWDPESLVEKPYDMEKVMRMFAAKNAGN